MVVNFRPCFVGRTSGKNGSQKWEFPGEEIVIGDDVWVGANCTVLKGARIGSGSVIATGAVVLKGEYPDHSLLAGNPATVVKSLA